jgi:hypothetical protein
MVVRRCSAHLLAKDRGLDRWSRLQHCGVTIVHAVVIGRAGDGRDGETVAVADFDSVRTSAASAMHHGYCADTVAAELVEDGCCRCRVTTMLPTLLSMGVTVLHMPIR